MRLPDTLRDFLPGPGEFVVTFRSKPLQSIRSAWRTHRVRWGFDDRVNPYSLRHTMGRWLRRQSVPPWEVAAQFGHKRADVSITDIYAPVDPHSLENAVRAIDAFLTELPVSPQARA